MEQVFEIDLHDYEAGDSIFSRPSARGVIFDDYGRIALIYSQKEKYYKLPGGSIHKAEDKTEEFIREVKEETSLTVIPDSIDEFSSLLCVGSKKFLQRVRYFHGGAENESIYNRSSYQRTARKISFDTG